MIATISASQSKTWLIVGASRGIGLEFVRQLLASGHRVLATARNPATSPLLDSLRSEERYQAHCAIYKCDLTVEPSIKVSLKEVYVARV